MTCTECNNQLLPRAKKYCSNKCRRIGRNKSRGIRLRAQNAKKKAARPKKACVKCGAEYAPQHTEKRCQACLYKRRQFERGACSGCGKNHLIVNAAKVLCFTCNKHRLAEAHGAEWQAEQERKRQQNTHYAREANRFWTSLRLENQQGGGRCCECGAQKNSLNKSLYCESCKRALNRLDLTLSEAANLV